MLPRLSRICASAAFERGLFPRTASKSINSPSIPRRHSTPDAEDLMNASDVRKYLSALDREFKKYENSSRPVASLVRERIECETYVRSLEVLSEGEKDKEMAELIRTDMARYRRELERINKDLVLLALPTDESDNRNAVIEITPGVGGTEAKLFAEELFRMYANFGLFKRWEESNVEIVRSEAGGIQYGTITFSGDLVFQVLKHEAGVHRVQRVPKTEKSGRVHTSTCKVIVLPEAEESDVVINDSDLKYEFKTSSGPGGQNVNKVETCVRLTHVPTGVVVEVQTSRLQHENKKLALAKIRNILFQAKLKEQSTMVHDLKKQQASTVDRSEKVRTYNFTQNRVTDHVLNHTLYNLSGYIEGSRQLDEMMSLRIKHHAKESLLNNVKKMVREQNFESLFAEVKQLKKVRA